MHVCVYMYVSVYVTPVACTTKNDQRNSGNTASATLGVLLCACCCVRVSVVVYVYGDANAKQSEQNKKLTSHG